MSISSRLRSKAYSKKAASIVRAVDLFCGAGGLTHGLEQSGIEVGLGIDIDPACEYPYTSNNNVSFRMESVENVCVRDLDFAFANAPIKLLAGCAPCQPFSTYNQGSSHHSDERWNLLQQFSRLVIETQPDLVTMENVPRLKAENVFSDFVEVLSSGDFYVSFSVVNCADYGVPQQRRRLVLLASRLGPITIIGPTTPEGRRLTVRDAIGDLPRLSAGEACESDRLHQACQLSTLNLQRIRASRPGGTWREWENALRAECHTRSTGKTYPSVYGRMRWDEPAPTVTTQYYGFGNGRFGHPEQDRAISLREGAILQGFPEDYGFVADDAPIYKKRIGRLIGNAVPVGLGKAIGQTITGHVQAWQDSRGDLKWESESSPKKTTGTNHI